MASLKFMPVSTSTCIFHTLPIWSAFLACIVLKEKITKYDIIQLTVAFAGVIIINNPFAEHLGDKDFSARDQFLGTFFGILGAMCGACATICMRYMNKGIHYSLSPFFFACGNTMLSPIGHTLMFSNFDEYTVVEKSTVYSRKIILLIAGASTCSFVG